MTARKVFAIVALLLIVPMIAMIRAQMTPDTGSTLESWSRLGVGTLLVIIPAFISEALWRSLQGWVPDHRLANYYATTAVATTKTRQRALLQYKAITNQAADVEHERTRLLALYEQAYREARNAQPSNGTDEQ